MAKENVRNILLAIIFLLILVVIALFIGRFTYSYLGAQVDDLLEGEGEVTASGDTIIFSKGNDLSLSASTDNFHTGSGNLTDTTNPQVRLIASSDTNNASTTYFAGIIIYENTYSYSTDNNTAELILSVYDENGTLLEASSDTLSFVEVNGVKGFDITGLTGAYNIAIDHPISTTSSTSGTTHTWTFTLTFVNLDTDQSINETANLEMEVVLQKDRIEPPTLADLCSSGENLATCIQTLYNTYGEGYGGLYLHDGVGTYVNADQEAGDNGYRYAGANPNNYVCFGSDAATCPSNNLYRIIGVFGSEVKLIKASSYGSYAWDSNNNNTWSTSSIRTTLNSTYLSTLSSTWQNKIATHTWKVGGMRYSNVVSTPKTAYNYEVGSSSSSTTDPMKIGLMYVSDYGFAASNSYWSTAISSYSSATSSNWLYLGSYEWTITRNSFDSNSAFSVYSTGCVSYLTDVTVAFVVRPSFYLNSNVEYNGGTGTESDPFTLVV